MDMSVCVVGELGLLPKELQSNMAKAEVATSAANRDITSELIRDAMAITEAPDAELWFRSSGRQCLMELMVLQSGYAYMHIEPRLWASVGFSEIIKTILKFQLHWPYIMMCQVLKTFGVENFTGYVFSTRNLLRDSKQDDDVLSAVVEFYKRTLLDQFQFRRLKLAISNVGDLDLLPSDLQANMAKVEIATSERNRDITAELIQDVLAITEAPETELWIRATGRQCFIEFLVQQSGYAYMHIDPNPWPAVQFGDLVSAIIRFQLHWPYIKGILPRSVAIAPDGNRRYAKRKQIPLCSTYVPMCQKLALFCQHMVHLGVEDITIAIFGLCNFLRNKAEVDAVLVAAAEFCKTTLHSL
ncbi:hypothetical protein HPB50_010835 [Hyalomma asiaticum]|uniref:Uncharacterized protein n=1 Tax=Hyalomma asiaticum TaxID=266040 RepID=A0ACB7RQE7_HYAAI|nr:hypothetical protein HPB50_010835 [Hyalomma asiaticum]